LFGDKDRRKQVEAFKFRCGLASYLAIEKVKKDVPALHQALWTLFCDGEYGTLNIFNCNYPLDQSQPDKAFRERVQRELLLCFEHSEDAGMHAVRAMVIQGVPSSTSSQSIIDAVKSCFNFPAADGIILLSVVPANGAIIVLIPNEIDHVPVQAIALHLGTVSFCHCQPFAMHQFLSPKFHPRHKVCAWKPKFFRQLFGNPGDINHLTGIMVEDIPARCVDQSAELDYLKEILGVQKFKTSLDTRVSLVLIIFETMMHP